MAKSAKRINAAYKDIDRTKLYSLDEAIKILKNSPKAKFNESVDLSFDLNVDPKKSDQMIRGTVVLPHGTGKTIKIAVFCKGEIEKQAKQAGADYIGAEDLIEKVNKGFLGFDCAIATPDLMKDVSKLGKVLGPRNLMPSPKTGTVTMNIAGAIQEFKKGKVEFKLDKQADIHVSVGKISFGEEKLNENAKSIIDAVIASRPQSVKGNFIKSASISTTMGPGLKLLL
ncbi:MAG: 50S ribosomal protein L1 [Candidatus Omnitrophota bacterium]